MRETTMSVRMEKLRSNNFIKNFNHSNRTELNTNHYQLGKHIDKKQIHKNVFLVNNPIIDDCRNISEVWKIFEDDYKLHGNDYTTKKINKKVKFFNDDGSYEYRKDDKGSFICEMQESRCKVPFIRKTQNAQKNVNGKMVSEQVETSIISEFVFQIGGIENDVRDILKEEDFTKLYQIAVDIIKEETKGTILKAIIHNDESYPHLHIFFTPYNIDTHQVQNSWTSKANNISALQDKLHLVMKSYLLKNNRIYLKDLVKKEQSHQEHLDVKAFKLSKNSAPENTYYNNNEQIENNTHLEKLSKFEELKKSVEEKRLNNMGDYPSPKRY